MAFKRQIPETASDGGRELRGCRVVTGKARDFNSYLQVSTLRGF